MEVVKTAVVRLFDCIISRRGKGAKGTVPVKTFGKPLKNKPNRKGFISKTTKKWSYEHADSILTESLMQEVAKVAPINEILMRGADAILKSGSIRGQSQVAVLAARLWAEGLAQDHNEAKTVAQSMLSQQALERKNDSDITPIDKLIANRHKTVEKLKAKGLWRVKPVASLVKEVKQEMTSEEVEEADPEEVEPEESEEEENEEEEEETEEEEEEEEESAE